MGLLGRSYRFEWVRGEEHLRALTAEEKPAVLSFWHDRVLGVAYHLVRHCLRRGYPITILVSRSRDGELGALLTRRWGAGVVRGSATRGGSEGLRRLYRAISRDGSAVVTIPDGPHGPRHAAKPGAVVLAQMSGAVILPLALAASSYWTLGSWDRMIVPRPFSRVALVAGEPIQVSRQASEAELESERKRLERVLGSLVEEAEAYLTSAARNTRSISQPENLREQADGMGSGRDAAHF